ncbi:MAG: carbohydrate-binding domain-containing protein [Oscillospiraceae bacterium]|nr:carbohydrate-binding domain-containing protein [Oscillospiraceae bacterium]
MKILSVLMALVLVLTLGACGVNEPAERENPELPEIKENEEQTENPYENAVKIVLSEKDVAVDGKPAEESGCVTVGGEIIYYHDMDVYPSGNPYGEGEESDRHTETEAAEHTLVTITEPGEYIISGSLKGQLAVDLGEEAAEDPNAKVTLVFNGADITCEIAPAVIFYNVYECADAENPTGNVDTSGAGANVIIADESENNVKGANVARIYKDGSEGKKLHKYDGAFYSVMSMNINGGEKGTGVLNIEAENEGLNSEMHLTVNGGNINITAQDDGINTNEDGISVTTINGGAIVVKGGLGAEGDGIDSNGWLVINGGALYASGSGKTGDGGIDADMGIAINGGTVVAFGSRNDAVQSGGQTCVQLSFASLRSAGSLVEFVDEQGYGMTAESDREFQSLTLSGENLEKNKAYRLYVNNVLQEYSGSGNAVVPGMGMGGFEGNFGREEKNAFNIPEGFEEWLDSAEDIPEDIRKWLENIADMSEEFGGRMQPGAIMQGEGTMPQMPQAGEGGMQMIGQQKEPPEALQEEKEQNAIGSIKLTEVYPTEFVITNEEWSFYGISDSAYETGKTRVTFTVDGKDTFGNLEEGKLPGIKSIECSKDIGSENIQLTLEYTGSSEEITVSKICLLSDGYDAVNELFKGLEVGEYRFTAAVDSGNKEYTGSVSFDFVVKQAN